MATFKEAFREARKAGDKTFTWNGKKYTTEYKEEAEAKALSKASKDEAGGFRSRRASAAMDEPKKEAPKAVKAAPRDIPVGKEKAPKSTGESTSGPSEVEKLLMGMPMAGGAAALGVRAMRAKRAAAASKAAAKEFTKPKAAETTANTGRRFTDKEEMEAAVSSVKGAASRKDIQAARAKKEAEVAESTARGAASRKQLAEKREKLASDYQKMLDKYKDKKSSPRDRTREKAEFEFAKGGVAKKGKR